MVLDMTMEVQLEKTTNVGRNVRGWVPLDDMKSARSIDTKDRVMYDDWVGTVDEVSVSSAFLDNVAENVMEGGDRRLTWNRCLKMQWSDQTLESPIP